MKKWINYICMLIGITCMVLSIIDMYAFDIPILYGNALGITFGFIAFISNFAVIKTS